ncbi:hypothetical protein ALQ32_200113 [Pseudomonas syringae pv. tagetis]|uniref:Uncharacterized protein n=1 Tax=Pseudomonas syringae pv. tagetis TaxID=129140 RepID=A0A3M3ZFP0_9PSED|nr:hypothetical protein [Pseudomonas syringae group genomosp. 7]RMO93471.1 hypothetical protein ALQ32_200113 [Pseudomonas syringae pv. tagetis]
MIEYLIFGTGYSKQPEHIDWVLVGREIDKKLTKAFVVEREFVVDLIKTESASFRTATTQGNKYFKGAKVVIYSDKFLTTSPDASENNNLEELPTFSMPDDDIDKAIELAVKGIFG